MSFLNRIVRGEHLLDRNGKRFDTRPQETEMARQITELHERLDECERKHIHSDCDGPLLRKRVTALEKSVELLNEYADSHDVRLDFLSGAKLCDCGVTRAEAQLAAEKIRADRAETRLADANEIIKGLERKLGVR